jgi:hypothetical protein
MQNLDLKKDMKVEGKRKEISGRGSTREGNGGIIYMYEYVIMKPLILYN